MAIKNRADIQAEINSLFADNIAGDISASDLRSVVGDMVDSSLLSQEDFTVIAPEFSIKEWLLDADGFATSQVSDISVITGAIPANTTLGIHRISIDKSDADAAAFVTGYIVSSTNGDSTAYHSVSNLNVRPIGQIAGGDLALDTGLVNAVDELADLNNAGVTTNIFVADNDSVTVGQANPFNQVEFVLDTVASGGGISPTFEYSTGVGTWATLVLSNDGTDGMKQTGFVVWVLAAAVGWAPGTGGDYLVRITRTRNTVTTTPIVDQLILNAIVFYEWDDEGNLSINDINAAGSVTVGDDLTVVGTAATGALTVSSDIIINTGSITSISGAISFGNEDLVTTGSVSCLQLNIDGNIVNVDNVSNQVLSAGSTPGEGANLLLYGGAEATTPYDIRFRLDTVNALHYDHSASSWNFQANAIVTTGSISGGAGTFSGDVTVGQSTFGAVFGSKYLEVTSLTGAEVVIGRDDITENSGNFIGGLVFSANDAGNDERAGIQARASGSGNNMSLNFYTGNDTSYAANTPEMVLSATGILSLGATAIIGSTSVIPEEILHIFAGNSGATPHGATNVFIESDTNAGITVASGNTSDGYVVFADVDDNNVAWIRYDHNTDEFTIRAADTTQITYSGGSGSELTAIVKDLTVGRSVMVDNGGYNATTSGQGALYAESVNGVQIHGTGSVNDFRLLNSAGTQVLRNPTGTVDLFASGRLSVSGDGSGSAIAYFNQTNALGYGVLVNSTDSNPSRYAIKVVTGAGTAFQVFNDGDVDVLKDLTVGGDVLLSASNKGLGIGTLTKTSQGGISISSYAVLELGGDSRSYINMKGTTMNIIVMDITIGATAGREFFQQARFNDQVTFSFSNSTNGAVYSTPLKLYDSGDVEIGKDIGIGVTPTLGRLHIKQAVNGSDGGISLFNSAASDSLRIYVSAGNEHFIKAGGSGTSPLKLVASSVALSSDLTLTGGKLSITDADNESALSVTSSATTENGVQILVSSLTIGTGLAVYSNSSDASNRNVGSFWNDSTTATGATVLSVRQDAAQRALFIDQNGNAVALEIDSEATSAKALTIDSPTSNVLFDLLCSHATAPFGMAVNFTAASPDDNSSYFFKGADSTTNRILIYSDGDIVNHDGIYGTISDARLKTDFMPARSYWDDFKNLKYQTYLMNTDIEQYGEDASRRLGLVAQDVELIFPGLVKRGASNDDMMSVKSSIIDGVINSIVLQEALVRIETIEVANDDVFAEIHQISSLVNGSLKPLVIKHDDQIKVLEQKVQILETEIIELRNAA